MRRNPTDAEKRIWSMLRDKRLATFKFKRQQIIFPYIVDFVCLEARLIGRLDAPDAVAEPGGGRLIAGKLPSTGSP